MSLLLAVSPYASFYTLDRRFVSVPCHVCRIHSLIYFSPLNSWTNLLEAFKCESSVNSVIITIQYTHYRHRVLGCLKDESWIVTACAPKSSLSRYLGMNTNTVLSRCNRPTKQAKIPVQEGEPRSLLYTASSSPRTMFRSVTNSSSLSQACLTLFPSKERRRLARSPPSEESRLCIPFVSTTGSPGRTTYRQVQLVTKVRCLGFPT